MIVELLKDKFSGLKGKYQFFKISRKLKNLIACEILYKYGNKIFYDSLDSFLSENNVICNIIQNCYDTAVFGYKSKSQSISYYVGLFIEQQPNYSRFQYEIRNIIHKYFEIIYLSLNGSDNNETRVICNMAKELAFELKDEIQEIECVVKKIENKIDRLYSESSTSNNRFLFEE